VRLRPAHVLLVLTAAIVLTTAATATAQDGNCGVCPRVRGSTADTAQLLKELVERSATARDLVERIDRSDVVVYIRHEWFTSSTLRGRIGFLAPSTVSQRMLIIELASRYTHLDQLAALGHELQHAYEIASDVTVRDSRSLSEYYHRIGEASGYMGGAETFETAAAAATGRRVRTELLNPVTADVVDDADR